MGWKWKYTPQINPNNASLMGEMMRNHVNRLAGLSLDKAI